MLKQNAEDNGNRRFILIEMEDYADTITAERIRRVMSGYGKISKKTEGLGGSFDYYTIGEAIFNPDDTLNEAVGVDAIRNYVAYSEGIAAEYRTGPDNDYTCYLIGLNSDTAWIFYYQPDAVTCLDLDSGLVKIRRQQTRNRHYLCRQMPADPGIHGKTRHYFQKNSTRYYPLLIAEDSNHANHHYD